MYDNVIIHNIQSNVVTNVKQLSHYSELEQK